MTTKDLLNKKFGRLLVIEKTNKRNKGGSVIWICKCDCGKIIEANSNNLMRTNTKSCGCLQKDKIRYLGIKSKTNLQDKLYITEQSTLLKKANLTFIEEYYIKRRLTLKVKCNCCSKIYNICYYHLRNGVSCSCHRNKTETRIKNIIENMFDCSFNYRENKITELGKKSPDGYNPDLKLVLEFRGNQHYDKEDYRYSEINIKRYNEKIEIYKKLGLDLLEIYEYEIKGLNDFEISELIIKKLGLLGRNNIPKLKLSFVNIQNPKFLSYEEAQIVCIENGIKNQKDYWGRYLEISNFLPSHPKDVYINKWISWGEFLKTNNIIGSKTNNSLSKEIECIETKIVYISMAEAQRITGISNSSIVSCCKGKRKTAGGFHWRYYTKI